MLRARLRTSSGKSATRNSSAPRQRVGGVRYSTLCPAASAAAGAAPAAGCSRARGPAPAAGTGAGSAAERAVVQCQLAALRRRGAKRRPAAAASAPGPAIPAGSGRRTVPASSPPQQPVGHGIQAQHADLAMGAGQVRQCRPVPAGVPTTAVVRSAKAISAACSSGRSGCGGASALSMVGAAAGTVPVHAPPRCWRPGRRGDGHADRTGCRPGPARVAEWQHVHGAQQVAGDGGHPAHRCAVAREHAQAQCARSRVRPHRASQTIG